MCHNLLCVDSRAALSSVYCEIGCTVYISCFVKIILVITLIRFTCDRFSLQSVLIVVLGLFAVHLHAYRAFIKLLFNLVLLHVDLSHVVYY